MSKIKVVQIINDQVGERIVDSEGRVWRKMYKKEDVLGFDDKVLLPIIRKGALMTWQEIDDIPEEPNHPQHSSTEEGK